MVGALWTGISGLAGQQTALDNESNNIANVNTIGYKASRISFADQMYQDKIGKGTSILDAEKLYKQGNLKLTGVEYDMALSGDGFFAVASPNSGGTAETYYTRAGNFRMGDNGKLQDAAGNEVQGWAMSPLNAGSVVSTDQNVTRFTEDFTKLAASQIIKNANTVETYTAKMTDYNERAKDDSFDVFSGADYKKQATKISNVEILTSNYSSALTSYKNNPEQTSVAPSYYSNTLDFSAGISTLDSDGDNISIYIDGAKYTQAWDTDLPTTMKAFTDQLSNITGLNAWITDTATTPTKNPTDVDGFIRIESIVPGDNVSISQLAVSTSAGASVPGTIKDSTIKVESGSGYAAVVEAREALKKAVTGKEQAVYLGTDMLKYADGDVDTAQTLTYSLSIYDPISKQNINVPAATDGTPAPISIAIADDDTTNEAINKIVTAINADATVNGLRNFVEAENINGNLVIHTLNKNFDLEFSGDMKNTTVATIGDVSKNATHSGREGADAEFLEIKTVIAQTGSRGALQLKLDSLGITDSPFGNFSVDNTGLITMKQDGATFAIGQVAIALFNDNRGLEPIGDNLLSTTDQSGNPIFNLNNNKTADIKGSTLELSTADLSESLVNLMVFQRAFEANAKSITTADAILNTLIQLKR